MCKIKPRIIFSQEKKLIGKSITMSLINNRTSELWQDFMQNKKHIKNILGTDLYSIQKYDIVNISNFNPQTIFKKWATVEVESLEQIPKGMHPFTLEEGFYAVFIHKGLASEFQRTFQFIFREWLPNSEYELDDRPHFELLGKKYNTNSPNSEEEVWIPIKKKEIKK